MNAIKNRLKYIGPGLLVAVGYMDPGNWATDIRAGSELGYLLLSVIAVSNIFAIILQYLSLKLGIVTGKDLAESCRLYFPKKTNYFLWFLCELAIIACDLAEVLGTALALHLLFGIPIQWGVLITIADVLILLSIPSSKFRIIELLIGGLILVILCSFLYEIFLSKPALAPLVKGFIPSFKILEPSTLYLALGILGATVMPHNLYLHSNLVKQRFVGTIPEKIRSATFDTVLSLTIALIINASILVLAASAFNTKNVVVTGIGEAYHLLDNTLGVFGASIVFGIALLAAGQSSTITGTLAGQIVMEGFLNLKLRMWVRRLITRAIAIIPAFLAIYIYGDKELDSLLVFSQVVLSLQLSFAVIPLVIFTNNSKIMGNFRNSSLLKMTSWAVAVFIAGLNIYLVFSTF